MSIDHDHERPLQSETQAKAVQARRAKARMTAQKMQRLLEDRGWTQSDLARHAGLNRDVVSKLMTGKSFPTRMSLKAMADALSVPMEDLSDVYVEADAVKDEAVMAMHVPQGRPEYAWLTINKLVKLQTAVRVLQIVGADDPKAAD